MRLSILLERFEALREALRRRTAPLSRLCEFLLIRWPLYIALCLVFAALCFLPAALPMIGVAFEASWWWTLLTALAGLPVTLSAVYMLHPLPPSPGWDFSRQPLSSLGEAQVVLADTSLLTDGRREVLIALPLEPTPDLRKRPEAFSLGVAIAYTADVQSEETAQLMRNAAASLGVNLRNLTHLRPILGKTQLGSVPGVIVEDGRGRTSLFAGDPIELARMCEVIDGYRPRPITREDQSRIRAVTRELRGQGSLTLGFAAMDTVSGIESPIYLGMLALRDVISEDARLAVEALLEAGYSLQTQPIDKAYQPPMRLAALRQRLRLTDALYAPHVILSTDLLETGPLCIAAADHRHRRFDGPVLLAREWFGKMAGWLRLALGTALPLMLACVLGPANPLCCLGVNVLLTAGLIAAASDDARWDAAGLTLLTVALALRLFLLFAPVSAGAVMGLYAIAAAWVVSLHLARRWQLILACAAIGLIFTAMAWLLPGLSLLGGLMALLAGTLAGLAAGQLLR